MACRRADFSRPWRAEARPTQGTHVSCFGVSLLNMDVSGYQPSVLKIGPLTRLGGRMTAANVAFDDHPNEKRFSDRIETVTVDSVLAWLRRAGLSRQPVMTLR